MAKGFFITGSGTDVGKTHVSALLLRQFLHLGYKTTYMKPVETGCAHPSGEETLIGSDLFRILAITEYKTGVSLHSQYRFGPSCSPHLAARLANREIDISHIVSSYDKLIQKTSADIVIVEGAGGALAPISGRHSMADLMKALKIPAVVVTAPGLGTLNHTFLTLRVLEYCGIPLAGVVINNAGNIERDYVYEDNVETIGRHISPAPCLDADFSDALTSNYNLSNNERITEFCNDVISRA